MTTDDFICEVIRRRLVRVDASAGQVFGTRGSRRGVELGCSNGAGYRVCTLHLGAIRKQVKLHRLIWISVHGPITVGLVPDHINRIKSDNRIGNLRLVTSAQNAANRRSYTGASNPSAKISEDIAKRIRNSHADLRSYAKVSLTFGVSRSLVAQIIRGELWA